jgi:hypothetical protein
MRKFQPHAQTGYIRAVLRLTHFLERHARHRQRRRPAPLPGAPGR